MNIEKFQPKPESQYILTLTRVEMLALISVTGHISGDKAGPRGVFDLLRHQADTIELPHYNDALQELEYSITGRIKFVDEAQK